LAIIRSNPAPKKLRLAQERLLRVKPQRSEEPASSVGLRPNMSMSACWGLNSLKSALRI